MFFIISKVLGFFALPSNIIVVLGLFGVLLIGGRLTQLGLRLAAASVLLIAVCGFSPLGTALLLPLENRSVVAIAFNLKGARLTNGQRAAFRIYFCRPRVVVS